MTVARQQQGAQEPKKLTGIPEAWRQAEVEERFWRDHRDEFLTKYADHFVAVLNGEVLATSSDLADLLGLLQTKGVELRKVWIRFVTANPRQTLL